jgi:hypothetical protein
VAGHGLNENDVRGLQEAVRSTRGLRGSPRLGGKSPRSRAPELGAQTPPTVARTSTTHAPNSSIASAPAKGSEAALATGQAPC